MYGGIAVNKPKVGLSLSFCVQDIVLGKMDINNVHFISTGTKIENEEHWQWVMDDYSHSYWTMNPDLAVKVATQLRDAGKLIQPRLEGLRLPVIERRREHWVDIDQYNKLMEAANSPFRLGNW